MTIAWVMVPDDLPAFERPKKEEKEEKKSAKLDDYRLVSNPFRLCVLCANKINLYIETRNKRVLDEIYHIMIKAGRKLLTFKYKRYDSYLIEDVLYTVVGDTVTNISKDPERYCSQINSFYPYLNWVLNGRMKHAIKEYYAINSKILHMDNYDPDEYEKMFLRSRDSEFVPMPIDVIEKKERYMRFIKMAYKQLRSCPRFRQNAKYLVWPLVLSMIYENERLFDSLDYRDRTALKVFQCLITLRVIKKKVELCHDSR